MCRQISTRWLTKPLSLPARIGEFAKSADDRGEQPMAVRSFDAMSASLA